MAQKIIEVVGTSKESFAKYMFSVRYRTELAKIPRRRGQGMADVSSIVNQLKADVAQLLQS